MLRECFAYLRTRFLIRLAEQFKNSLKICFFLDHRILLNLKETSILIIFKAILFSYLRSGKNNFHFYKITQCRFDDFSITLSRWHAMQIITSIASILLDTLPLNPTAKFLCSGDKINLHIFVV